MKLRAVKVKVCKSLRKINKFIDDDSIVDLSAAAALLPVGEQEKPGVDQTLNPIVGTAESVISVGSKASTTESHPRVQEGHEQSPNFAKIKLSMDAEEALVFLLELMVCAIQYIYGYLYLSCRLILCSKTVIGWLKSGLWYATICTGYSPTKPTINGTRNCGQHSDCQSQSIPTRPTTTSSNFSTAVTACNCWR